MYYYEQKIQVQTFSQLRNLKILDLKENEIESILPETFKNMNIDGLTLSGNKKIRLFHGAFSRLTVKSLSILYHIIYIYIFFIV